MENLKQIKKPSTEYKGVMERMVNYKEKNKEIGNPINYRVLSHGELYLVDLFIFLNLCIKDCLQTK